MFNNKNQYLIRLLFKTLAQIQFDLAQLGLYVRLKIYTATI